MDRSDEENHLSHNRPVVSTSRLSGVQQSYRCPIFKFKFRHFLWVLSKICVMACRKKLRMLHSCGTCLCGYGGTLQCLSSGVTAVSFIKGLSAAFRWVFITGFQICPEQLCPVLVLVAANHRFLGLTGRMAPSTQGLLIPATAQQDWHLRRMCQRESFAINHMVLRSALHQVFLTKYLQEAIFWQTRRKSLSSCHSWERNNDGRKCGKNYSFICCYSWGAPDFLQLLCYW